MPLGLLLTLWVASPAANLIGGDTAFAAGLGPFVLTPAPGAAGTARLADGGLVLPIPDDAPGPVLELPLSEPLEPGEVYCLSWRAVGDDAGLAVRVTVRDPFGVLASEEVPVAGEWRESWVTFAARAQPRSAEEAAAAGLDWGGRWSAEPADPAGRPVVAVLLEPLWQGPHETVLRLREPRLTAGATPRRVARRPDVDVTVGETAGPLVVWREAPEPLRIRAVGGARETWCEVLTSSGVPLRSTRRDELAVGDLPVGRYRVRVTAEPDRRRTRDLLVLSAAPPNTPLWSIDASRLDRAADAMWLGYRRVRVPVTWAELADADGRARLAPLEARLRPAFAAGLQVDLILRLTPADALPARVITPRRMHSHGFQRDIPLGDAALYEAFVRELVAWFAGRGLRYELDQDAFRRWHAEDYAWYAGRFRAIVAELDAGATFAGVGLGFSGDPPATAALLDEAQRRGVVAGLAGLPVLLPLSLGDEPERYTSAGLRAAAADLVPRLARLGWPVPVEWTAPGVVPAGADGPGLRPPGAPALSDDQLAARIIRALAAIQRTQPAELPSGWRGGFSAVEAAVAVWRERLAGAVWQSSLDLSPQTEAAVFEQADGRGLALLWIKDDPRATMADERDDGNAPRLIVSTLGGFGARVHDLWGGERRDLYHGADLRLPLSFAPLYLDAASPGMLERLLRAARIEGHEALRVALGFDAGAGTPGLRLRLANDGAGDVAGELRLASRGGPSLAVDRLRYDVGAGGRADRVVPLTAWPDGAAGEVIAIAETDRRQVVARRMLLSWPADDGLTLTIDGDRQDWGAVPAQRLRGSERRVAGGEWLGPEDAELIWRGGYRDGVLRFHAEVVDDRLEVEPRAAFDQADAVVLQLDLDATDSGALGLSDDDYTLWLTPVFDGRVQGRARLDRGPGGGPERIDRAGLRWRFAETPRGYAFELALPLTRDGRVAVEEDRAIGLGVRLHDDDGGADRDLRLAAFGSGALDRPAEWAAVWLRAPDQQPAAPRVAPIEFAEPASRVSFDPSWARGGWRLTPDRYAGARVTTRSTDDFVRGEMLLRVDRDSPGPASTLLAVDRPADREARLAARLWCRGAGVTVRLVGTSGDGVRPRAEWRCFDRPLADGDGPLLLAVDGQGWLEVAELTLDRPRESGGDAQRIARLP